MKNLNHNNMKQTPILFSAAMVQAIIEGRKTQTRRIIKGTPLEWLSDFTPEFVADRYNNMCPYGNTGDVLWVRETWAARYCDTSTGICCIEYKASPGVHQKILLKKSTHLLMKSYGDGDKWKPSIHMQKVAARIWLLITDIRIEKLNEISEDDARSEGIPNAAYVISPIESFKHLWQSINGPESWGLNPWVWVIEFKRIEKPINTTTK